MSGFSVNNHTGSNHFATLAIHVGSEPDPITGAVVPPISLATTFAQAGLGHLNGMETPSSHGAGFEYIRTGNPTRGAFERAIAAVEGGEFAIAFASGLAATNSIIQMLEPGDHVVCIDDVYGGTQRLFRRIAKPQYGLDFTFVDMSDMAVYEQAFTPKTRLVWVETPTNPTLKITDIRAVAEIAKKHNALLVVDNTFMTPYLQRPLELGADLVLHSVTKYIGGHSDVLMGVVIGRDMEIWKKMRFIQNSVGAVPAPFDCYMAIRGLKTLHVRMEAAQSNAMKVAQYLEAHAQVSRVIYPGLESHPQHQLARTQQSGFGAMITFYLRGDLAETGDFLKALKLWTLAESLGAVESLVECPAIMTHASVPKEQRVLLGIDDNMIRLSVGIEHVDDLIKDLSQAFKK